MPEVRLSTGETLRFPDGMTPAQVEAATRNFVRQRGQQGQPAAGPVPQVAPRQALPAVPAGPTGLLSPSVPFGQQIVAQTTQMPNRTVARNPQPGQMLPLPGIGAPALPVQPQIRLGDVAERAQQAVQQTVPQIGRSRVQAFGHGMLNRFVSQIANLGELALQGPGIVGRARRRAEQGGLLGPVPELPGPEQVRAGIRATGRAVQAQPPDFLTLLEEEQRISRELREQHPVATAAGEVGADVATLVTGRLPVSGAISRARRQFLEGGGRAFADASPGVRRLANQVFDSKTVRALADRAGRSVETGIEGAALALLDDGDPIEVAAYAAGGQAAGSIALGLTSTKGGLLGLAGLAAGFGALAQLTKAAVPGGRDFILESIESGFEKVMWGLVAGAASATLGLGRRSSGRLAENLPALTDAFVSMRRGAALSFLKDLTKAEEQGDRTPELVINKLSRDPEFFGRTAARRIERALQDPSISLVDEIDRMTRLPSFREKLDQLGGSNNGR